MARELSKTKIGKHSMNAFRLTSLAGQLGRQGVKGPVELFDKASKPPRPKKKRTPRARAN